MRPLRTVESASIITDRDSGRSQASASPRWPAPTSAGRQALNGSQQGGRALTVNEAKPREDRGGGGGRGGFGGGGGRPRATSVCGAARASGGPRRSRSSARSMTTRSTLAAAVRPVAPQARTRRAVLPDERPPVLPKRLSRAAATVIPVPLPLVRCVWATSRLSGQENFVLNAISAERDGAVALLRHEEVSTVAPPTRTSGSGGTRWRASGTWRADLAHADALRLRRVFAVARAPAGRGRRSGVLEAMIAHMRENHDVIYTGSPSTARRPSYRMKTGGIVIAREWQADRAGPHVVPKCCLRLNTWDRMAILLPFNEIRYYLRGPYYVPEDANTAEGLARFRLQLENDLIDIAAQSYRDAGHPIPEALVKRSADENDDIDPEHA